MLEVDAGELAALSSDLGTFSERCWVDPFLDDPHHIKVADVYQTVRKLIYGVREVLADIPVSRHMEAAMTQSENEVQEEEPNYRDFNDLRQALKSLLDALVVEFQGASFLYIPDHKVQFYKQSVALFGYEVTAWFPDSSDDISAAGRCYAVDEWTAVVFHLMRVAEYGLRALAKELQIGLSDRVDLESWKVVIDQINKAIKNYEETEPRSPEKSERLRTYSEAAVMLGHFKNAWRNHVSHARGKYDARDAVTVWNAVRAFMQGLAKAQIGAEHDL
jgi:hypothetical protein